MTLEKALEEYQKRTGDFAIYPSNKIYEYLVSGLASEVGEVAGVYAKALRDGHGLKETLEKMNAELGDVLWFVAQLAAANGTNLTDLMEQNIKKLEDRKHRGVLKGSGDER